ncbi:MAG: 4Fe-4S binding protein [Candidatus Latescibacteria bacterium]|nr:4Fe-4S binding protein [Candidatus Latescibacterota bacterium]
MLDRLFANKLFPAALQFSALFVFIMLIGLGWGITTDDPAFAKILRNTNLANLIVWSFWWPLIIAASVLFGRLWCTVCPMELIQFLLNRVGLKRPLPKFLRSGWIITLLYALVLVVGIEMFSIHRIPHRMSLYMTGLFGLTILVSLVYEKRGFCTGFCPVGHLLGLYSMNAGMELRVRDRAVCDACSDKPCVNKKRDYVWYGRACQSYLFPGSLRNNRDCILCTQCIKACPHDNVTFRFRRPLADFAAKIRLSIPQIGFIFIVFAFAFSEVVTEWSRSASWYKTPYHALVGVLGLPSPWDAGAAGILMFVVTPFVVLTLVSWIQGVFGRSGGPFSTLAVYIASFIPLIASVHFAKAVVKSVSRFQYIPGILADPAGVVTARALYSGALTLGGGWQGTLNIIARSSAIGIMAAGGVAAVYLLVRTARREGHGYPVAYVFLTVAYLFCTIGALVGKMM